MSAILALISVTLLTYLAADRWGGEYFARLQKPKRDVPLHELPDILEATSLCAEAGMDLTLALERILTPRREDPLPAELYLVIQEIKAGSTKADAWRRFANRNPAEDVRLFVSLVLQSETLGTGLAGSVRSLAQGMRERRFRLAEKRALEAPVKLMLPMGCVFIAIFVVIGGALYLDIATGGL